MSQTTYLTEQDVEACVAFSGHEIKEFYSYFIHHNAKSPYGEWANGFNIDSHDALKEIVLKFCGDKTQLLVDKLVKNGEGIDAHIHPVRIEVRKTKDVPGASQIAVRGVYEDFRQVTLNRFKANDDLSKRALSIKMSGQMSFEINVKGVDKALPFHYLSKNLKLVLAHMGYQPGNVINANDAPMIIAADADGTTYGFPSEKGLPTLAESPAFEAIMEFLRLGGIYMIISGNAMDRTLSRVVDSVPQDLRSNVIVVANGAADMAVVGPDGQFDCLTDYRAHALKSLEGENKIDSLNVTYLGDDGKIHGNDYPAYEALGIKRAILVCDQEKTDDVLQDQCVGGHEEGTRRIMDKINQDTKQAGKALEFSEDYIRSLMTC